MLLIVFLQIRWYCELITDTALAEPSTFMPLTQTRATQTDTGYIEGISIFMAYFETEINSSNLVFTYFGGKIRTAVHSSSKSNVFFVDFRYQPFTVIPSIFRINS